MKTTLITVNFKNNDVIGAIQINERMKKELLETKQLVLKIAYIKETKEIIQLSYIDR